MKNWSSLVLFSLVLAACSSSKSTSTTTTTPIYHPKQTQEEKTQPVVTAPETPAKEKEVEDVVPVKKDVVSKSSYNIAVLLPFMTDKIPLNYTPYQIDVNVDLSPEMTQSLDFYMGLKMAADDFRNKSNKVNIFILDDANSDFQTKKLLSERPFPDIDVIVSGSSNRISKEILKYSAEKNVPVFSPFTTEISQATETFYAALPSVNHQTEQLFVKIQNLYPEAHIQIIQDNNDDSSAIIVKSMEKFLKNELNVTPEIIRNTTSTVNENGETISFFQPTSTNIVLIASDKESFVRSTLTKLYGAPFPPYILGLPSWSGFKGLENEIQPNPSIYIPAIQLATKTKAEKEAFSSRFAEDYQMEENPNVYMGYDLMNFIMATADKGRLSDVTTSVQLGLKPFYYNFDFIPVSNQNGIQFFTNSQVGVLKYEKGKFNIVKL